MSSINSRIKGLINALGLSQNAFAKALNTSGSRISNILTDRNKPDSEILVAILTVFRNVNSDWLMTGNGSMFRDGTIVGEPQKDVHLKRPPKSPPISKSENLGGQMQLMTDRLLEGEKVALETSDISPGWEASRLRMSKYTKNVAKSVSIDIIDVRAAANWSGVAIADDMPETLGQIELPTRMLKSGNHKAFTVVGDSMEPTLYPGDYVVGRLIEKSEYEQIRDHFIYIVVTREGVVIKRLINRLRQRGEIRCRSDNRKYSAYNVQEDDIISVFEAKAKLSFNFTNEQGNLFDMYHDLEEKIDDLSKLEKRIEALEKTKAR